MPLETFPQTFNPRFPNPSISEKNFVKSQYIVQHRNAVHTMTCGPFARNGHKVSSASQPHNGPQGFGPDSSVSPISATPSSLNTTSSTLASTTTQQTKGLNSN
jgi:hypothetical protein